jgi:hypothetical protein
MKNELNSYHTNKKEKKKFEIFFSQIKILVDIDLVQHVECISAPTRFFSFTY